MKVKHLKTKTTIELTPEEANNLIKRVHDIDQMADTIMECQDLWLSDVSKLQNDILIFDQILSYILKFFIFTTKLIKNKMDTCLFSLTPPIKRLLCPTMLRSR